MATKPTQDKTVISLPIDRDTHRKLLLIAEREDRTLVAAIRRIIKAHLEGGKP